MQMISCLILLLISICLWFPINSMAAGLCCQLSSGVQESLSGVAAPGTGEASVQFNYSLTRMDTFKQGGKTRSLDDIKADTPYTSLPLSMDMVKYTLTAGYGFTPKFKAFVSVPYLRNTMDMTSSNGALLGWTDMTMAPVSGLGDATIMGLYRIFTDRNIRPNSAVTAGFGVKSATGSSTERSSNGRLIHAHMQPGTGSWDPLLSVMYSRMMNPFLIQADATYQLATMNREGYKLGNSLAVTATGKYAASREFNVLAGLTWLTVGKASDRDGKYYNPVTNSSLIDDPTNTGGKSLWVSPGIQVLPVKNIVIDLKVQLPVWERVNGVQLVSSYRFLAGISYGF